MKKFGEKQAKVLLEAHARIKGPDELENWNIRAQTLLVFIAMNKICSVSSVGKKVDENSC
ncbi:MAG TPA: hypothetical protein ENH94_04400 [Phycisphaerales bacterium]|nr:hypothetical protein [Phycisphaerales bacterium]